MGQVVLRLPDQAFTMGYRGGYLVALLTKGQIGNRFAHAP